MNKQSKLMYKIIMTVGTIIIIYQIIYIIKFRHKKTTQNMSVFYGSYLLIPKIIININFSLPPSPFPFQ